MATITSNLNPTAGTPPIFIDASTIQSLLPHKSLITHLQTSLPSATSLIKSPIRHSHQTSPSSTLLLMPAWSLHPTTLPYTGVKLVTTHPLNSALNLPGVHASYVLFSSLSGQPLATFDATELTLRRTAAVSALASHYLSNKTSQVLLMVGAGSLAPHLIKAHITTRPSIKHVIIWNRTVEKSRHLVEILKTELKTIEGLRVEVCEDVERGVGMADIVTCATNSEQALVKGKWLKEGAHLDLVGSYKPTMRECDDEAVKRGRVFVDNEAALVEAGELVGAFERGVMKEDEVEGDLVELITGEKSGRKDEKEVTVFVSVGSAVVDLLSAQLAYETVIKA